MRIGILGGSFNPVHNGHLRVAVEALEQLGLARVDLVPAAQPPHKPDSEIMPFERRLQLLDAAVQHHPDLEVNPLEGRRRGPSYTVETLEEYLASWPQAELFFLLGCSDFLTLPKWHEWERLFSLTHFAIVARYGSDKADLDRFLLDRGLAAHRDQAAGAAWTTSSGNRVHYLEIPQLDISGTLIRHKRRQALSVDFLVPDPVARLLEQDSPTVQKDRQ